jgi:hypothetical protein
MLGLPLKRGTEAAFVAINNLFAAADDIRSVKADAIARACAGAGVTLDEIGPRRAHLYRDYLRYCLVDHHLSEDELARLSHLADVLGLAAQATAIVQRRVTREIYSKTVDAVLADARIDADERSFLEQMRDQLGIPRSIAENIEAMKARQREAWSGNPPGPKRRPDE